MYVCMYVCYVDADIYQLDVSTTSNWTQYGELNYLPHTSEKQHIFLRVEIVDSFRKECQMSSCPSLSAPWITSSTQNSNVDHDLNDGTGKWPFSSSLSAGLTGPLSQGIRAIENTNIYINHRPRLSFGECKCNHSVSAFHCAKPPHSG